LITAVTRPIFGCNVVRIERWRRAFKVGDAGASEILAARAEAVIGFSADSLSNRLLYSAYRKALQRVSVGCEVGGLARKVGWEKKNYFGKRSNG
jgi:hypothetical protein